MSAEFPSPPLRLEGPLLVLAIILVAGAVALAFVAGLRVGGKSSPHWAGYDHGEVVHDFSDEVEPQLERYRHGSTASSQGESDEVDRVWQIQTGEPVQRAAGSGAPMGGAGSTAQTGEPAAANVSIQRFTVQVGAYRDEENARSAVEGLREKFYNPYLVLAHLEDGRWYRVRIGSFSSRSAARLYAEEFRNREGMEAFVTVASD